MKDRIDKERAESGKVKEKVGGMCGAFFFSTIELGLNSPSVLLLPTKETLHARQRQPVRIDGHGPARALQVRPLAAGLDREELGDDLRRDDRRLPSAAAFSAAAAAADDDDASAAAAASAAVVPPRLFAPFYLLLALSCACLAPAVGLAHSLLTTGGLSDSTAAGASAAVALGPYLALFAWQWLLEMKLCRRSLLAPAVPLAFSLARPWQLARSAALVEYLAEAAAAVPLASALAGEKTPLPLPSPPWLPAALRLLSLFWTFDTAALLVWLPWTYNWQTQA